MIYWLQISGQLILRWQLKTQKAQNTKFFHLIVNDYEVNFLKGAKQKQQKHQQHHVNRHVSIMWF